MTEKQSEKSYLEARMARQIEALSFPTPEREYHFAHPEREWRSDFAWPGARVILEVEGGVFGRKKGRHTTGVGYTDDCIKYSTASILGWKVIRVTGPMIRNGMAIQLLGRALCIEVTEDALEEAVNCLYKRARRKSNENSQDRGKNAA